MGHLRASVVVIENFGALVPYFFVLLPHHRPDALPALPSAPYPLEVQGRLILRQILGSEARRAVGGFDPSGQRRARGKVQILGPQAFRLGPMRLPCPGVVVVKLVALWVPYFLVHPADHSPQPYPGLPGAPHALQMFRRLLVGEVRSAKAGRLVGRNVRPHVHGRLQRPGRQVQVVRAEENGLFPERFPCFLVEVVELLARCVELLPVVVPNHDLEPLARPAGPPAPLQVKRRFVLGELPRPKARGPDLRPVQIVVAEKLGLGPVALFRPCVVVIVLPGAWVFDLLVLLADHFTQPLSRLAVSVAPLEHPRRLVRRELRGRDPGLPADPVGALAQALAHLELVVPQNPRFLPRDLPGRYVHVVEFPRLLVLELLPLLPDHRLKAPAGLLRSPRVLDHPRGLLLRVHVANAALQVGDGLFDLLKPDRRGGDRRQPGVRRLLDLLQLAARLLGEREEGPQLLHLSLYVRLLDVPDPLGPWVVAEREGDPVVLDPVPRVGGLETLVAVVPVRLRVVLHARVAPAGRPVPRAPKVQGAPGPLVRDDFDAVRGHRGVHPHQAQRRGLAPCPRGQRFRGLHAAQLAVQEQGVGSPVLGKGPLALRLGGNRLDHVQPKEALLPLFLHDDVLVDVQGRLLDGLFEHREEHRGPFPHRVPKVRVVKRLPRLPLAL